MSNYASYGDGWKSPECGQVLVVRDGPCLSRALVDLPPGYIKLRRPPRANEIGVPERCAPQRDRKQRGFKRRVWETPQSLSLPETRH